MIQDDALPCKNFAAALLQIAERHQDVPVCLFMGTMPASTALQAKRAIVKDRRYVTLLVAPFMPLVAVLWPRAKAQDFLFWAQNSPKITRADDGNAARWMRQTKQRVLVTVPSLVQHDETQPSVKGSDNSGSWCRALFLAEDALEYEW